MRAVASLALAGALAGPLAPAARGDEGGLSVGSYGRVVIGTDLRGGTPEQPRVVAHPPRVVEGSYLELDLYYDFDAVDGLAARAVITPAVAGEPFHFTGQFDAAIALRNAYVEATLRDVAAVWVGSRNYRGDDIYLLDVWPLRDYNAIGGGARWWRGPWRLSGHVGAHRLLDPFQHQLVEVPDPVVGSATIEQLDRQRLVASVTPAYVGARYKAELHADVHVLGAGRRRRPDNTIEELPDDTGWSVGAQVGTWGVAGASSHANLFVRYARGLAAYDELDVPAGLGPDKRARGASELALGLSAHADAAYGGAIAGALVRRFVDADGNADDNDDGWEAVADVRPYAAWFRGSLQVAADLSVQRRWPRGVSPVRLEPVTPTILAVAPMIILSPAGARAFARPHLRLVYRAAHLDAGARDQYPVEDPRRRRAWVHFLGLQAEWWFHSSSYP